MKEFVKKGMSILEFGMIAETSSIEARFLKVHNGRLSSFPKWTSIGTRRLLISDYWLSVFKHYSALIFLPLIIVVTYARAFNVYFLVAVLYFLMIGFVCLYISMYRRVFNQEYLPYLEALTDRYHAEQQHAVINELREQLQTVTFQFQQYQEEEQVKREKQMANVVKLEKAAAEKLLQAKEIQESGDICRKNQYHTFTLTLIFQALGASCFKSDLKSDPKTLALLNKLFGVAPTGLRDCIDIINGVNGTRDKVKNKNFTYKRGDFDDAYSFLEAWGYEPAQKELKRLEQVILQRNKK